MLMQTFNVIVEAVLDMLAPSAEMRQWLPQPAQNSHPGLYCIHFAVTYTAQSVLPADLQLWYV